MDFLGGGLDFSGSVPSYGDVGGGYTGDFFGGSNSGSGIGSALIGGVGKGLMSGLGNLFSSGSTPGSGQSRSSSYVGQTQDRMRDLLALALASFDTPKSTI